MAPDTAQLPPFKRGWWSFDLGQYRPCDGTYCLYPFESLPPIPPDDESLAWLVSLPGDLDRQMALYRNSAEPRGSIQTIAAAAAQLGLTLPPSFQRLMGAPELQHRIPSCTACTFQLGDRIVPCPGSEHGYIVGFMHDQQDVLLWYLYLTPRGDQAVLVAPYPLDELSSAAERSPLAPAQRQAVLERTYICGPTFASFLSRWWLENGIWFKLDAGQTSLTEAERRYLAHYASNESPS